MAHKFFSILLFSLLINSDLSSQTWIGRFGKMYVNPTSTNVGIGTTNPVEKLHINGNIRGNQRGALRIHSGYGWVDVGAKNSSWVHFNTNKSKYYFDKEIRVNTGYIGTYDDNLYLRTQGTTRMFINKSNGNVGIGTTSPVSWAKLDIVSSSNSSMRLKGRDNRGNYSAINFTSDENVDKQWEIIHRSGFWISDHQNALLFAHNNGSGWVQTPMIILSNGNVGIGKNIPSSKLDINGTTTTKILEITGGSDLAESFEINSTQDLKPGMVVSIDPQNPGKLVVSNSEYDTKVAGIISGANGINTGLILNQKDTISDGEYPVALTGRVYCYVDASENAIAPGDLLTTSTTPGYAMKAIDTEKLYGSVIGKAMTALQKGEKGMVLVLVGLK